MTHAIKTIAEGQPAYPDGPVIVIPEAGETPTWQLHTPKLAGDIGVVTMNLAGIASEIKEDFQKGLLDKKGQPRTGDQRALDQELRAQSIAKIFSQLGMLKVGERSTLDEKTRPLFYTACRIAEAESDDRANRDQIIDLMEGFEDHPALQVVEIFRRISPEKDSATKLLRTTLVLIAEHDA